MTGSPYSPQPGSAAALAIAALAAKLGGTRLPSRELARLMGLPSHENLGKKLERAVDAGLIDFTLVHTKVGVWSLTEAGRLYLAQAAVVQGLKADLERVTGLS